MLGPTAAVANWDARKTVSASEADEANYAKSSLATFVLGKVYADKRFRSHREY